MNTIDAEGLKQRAQLAALRNQPVYLSPETVLALVASADEALESLAHTEADFVVLEDERKNLAAIADGLQAEVDELEKENANLRGLLEEGEVGT